MKVKSKELIECLIENVEKIDWLIDFAKITTYINSTKISISVDYDNEYSMELQITGKNYEIKEDQDILKNLYEKVKKYQESVNLNNSIDEIINSLNG